MSALRSVGSNPTASASYNGVPAEDWSDWCPRYSTSAACRSRESRGSCGQPVSTVTPPRDTPGMSFSPFHASAGTHGTSSSSSRENGASNAMESARPRRGQRAPLQLVFDRSLTGAGTGTRKPSVVDSASTVHGEPTCRGLGVPAVEPSREKFEPAHRTSVVGQPLSVAALFAGIGGLELGLQRAGHSTGLLCEIWEPAQAVLKEHFGEIPLLPDIRELPSLPADTDLVTAGFPCTDLSQAGRTAGIRGKQSSLVEHVFRLLDQHSPRWLLLENVRNMLPLDGGYAMRYLVDELEQRRYRWAYRVVDSRFAGVPQRRHRVLLLASRTDDPRGLLLGEDAGEPEGRRYRHDAFGFYWTEGLRGLGWAQDAVPPLKGGSTIGIPSPPGVWLVEAQPDRALVKPSIEDAEALQGFPRGWTEAVQDLEGSRGARWKLVGNAVTVDVARWVGERLAEPTDYDSGGDIELATTQGWPNAAWGESGRRWASPVSMWPRHEPYTHLTDLMDSSTADPLSLRGAIGFFDRLERGNLRPPDAFRAAVKDYIRSFEG